MNALCLTFKKSHAADNKKALCYFMDLSTRLDIRGPNPNSNYWNTSILFADQKNRELWRIYIVWVILPSIKATYTNYRNLEFCYLKKTTYVPDIIIIFNGIGDNAARNYLEMWGLFIMARLKLYECSM